MSKVAILTTRNHTKESPARKETDLDLPGNRRWLVSHIRWAVKFGEAVTIHPIV